MSLLDDVSIVVTPNGYKAGELYAVVPVPTEGAEILSQPVDLVTDFSVNSGGVIVDADTFTTAGGIFDGIRKNSFLTLGKRYKLTIEGDTTSSGFTIGDTAASGNEYGTDFGTFYFTAVGNGSLWIRQTTSGTTNITSFTLKEYTAADMDVTRATAATRVDEAGLVNYAEIIGSDLVNTIINNNNPFPTFTDNGGGSYTMATTTTAYSGFEQPDADRFAVAVGEIYKLTFDFVLNSGALDLELFIGSASVGSSYGNKHTCQVGSNTVFITIFTSNSSARLVSQINSVANMTISNIVLKKVDRNNVPRIDYTGGGCPHILAEPQRTNLVTESNTSNFGAVRSTRGVQETKLGIIEGYKYSYTSANANINKNFSESTLGYKTLSVYFDATNSDFCKLNLASGGNGGAGAQVLFTPSTQTFGSIGENATYVRNSSASFESLGNNIYRVMLTTEFISYLNGTTFPIIYFGDNSNVWIGGVQVEQGSFPTSIIPTSGSTVTRNQDQFTRDGIGSLINSTEGVLFAELSALANDGLSKRITLADGSISNRVSLELDETANKIKAFISRGGASQILEYTAPNLLQFNKIGIKWKENDFALWFNGNEVATDSSGNVPIGLTELVFEGGNSFSTFFGKVKQLQVYKTALTDEQLIQLTGTSGTDFYESYAEMASALTYTIQ